MTPFENLYFICVDLLSLSWKTVLNSSIGKEVPDRPDQKKISASWEDSKSEIKKWELRRPEEYNKNDIDWVIEELEKTKDLLIRICAGLVDEWPKLTLVDLGMLTKLGGINREFYHEGPPPSKIRTELKKPENPKDPAKMKGRPIGSGSKKPSLDLLKKMKKEDPDFLKWTAIKMADFAGCSPTTMKDSDLWKHVIQERERNLIARKERGRH